MVRWVGCSPNLMICFGPQASVIGSCMLPPPLSLNISYVTICQKMLQDHTQALNFDTFFLPNLAALVVDPVTDVRLAVARLLNEAYNNGKALPATLIHQQGTTKRPRRPQMSGTF